jgi:hypothetical protein
MWQTLRRITKVINPPADSVGLRKSFLDSGRSHEQIFAGCNPSGGNRAAHKFGVTLIYQCVACGNSSASLAHRGSRRRFDDVSFNDTMWAASF